MRNLKDRVLPWRGLTWGQRAAIFYVVCFAEILAPRDRLRRFGRHWEYRVDEWLHQHVNPFANLERDFAEYLTVWAFVATVAAAVAFALAASLGWRKGRAAALAAAIAALPSVVAILVGTTAPMVMMGLWVVASVYGALKGSFWRSFISIMYPLEEKKDSLLAALAAIFVVFGMLCGGTLTVLVFFAMAMVAAYLGALVGVIELGKHLHGWSSFPSWWSGSEALGALITASGVLVGLWAGLFDGAWRMRQLRQLKNLPTSKARSAALGLAEFRGVARNTKERALNDTAGPLHPVSPFYIEDDTGRILIDPGQTEARFGWWWLQFGRRFHEAVLTRGRKSLQEGAPIYVLGTVELRDDAARNVVDSDALVVRARTTDVHPSPSAKIWRRLLFPWEGYAYVDVFFLSDEPEADARRHIRNGLIRTGLMAALWTACSLLNLLLF